MLLLDNVKAKWDDVTNGGQFFIAASATIASVILLGLFVTAEHHVMDLNDAVKSKSDQKTAILDSCEHSTVVHVDGVYYKCQRVYTDAQAQNKLEAAVKSLQFVPGTDASGTVASVTPN